MTTTSDHPNPAVAQAAPGSIGAPRIELVSPDELRAAYPDPHPSTAASPDVRAHARSARRLGPVPDRAAQPRGEDDDVTTAQSIGKVQDLELAYRIVGKIERKLPGGD